MKKQTEVRLAYGKQVLLDVDEISDLQGKLKILTEENYQRMKKEVMETGFAFSPHVWQHPKSKKWYFCDGHQRGKMLKRLREEGIGIPKLLCTPVEAANEEEALERVAQGTSQYGTMTNDGLLDFMKRAKLKVDALDRFNFPEINMPEIRLALLPPEPEKKDGEAKENVSFEAYKNAAVKQIVLYYPKEQYEKVIAILDELLKKYEVEDYSQAIWKKLNAKN